MPVTHVEVKRYECDRCGETAEYGCDEDARIAGWVVMPYYPGNWTVLCPLDKAKLDRFLMGSKTGAGLRFNVGEDRRWEDSCR